MTESPIQTIGGGGRLRRCTRYAAENIDFLAREIFEGHEKQLLEIGFKQPAASVAIDFLLFIAQREGINIGIDRLDAKNNLYLAISNE